MSDCDSTHSLSPYPRMVKVRLIVNLLNCETNDLHIQRPSPRYMAQCHKSKLPTTESASHLRASQSHQRVQNHLPFSPYCHEHGSELIQQICIFNLPYLNPILIITRLNYIPKRASTEITEEPMCAPRLDSFAGCLPQTPQLQIWGN